MIVENKAIIIGLVAIDEGMSNSDYEKIAGGICLLLAANLRSREMPVECLETLVEKVIEALPEGAKKISEALISSPTEYN